MDSVTQFALGAAIGEACLGRKHGAKAALWGGLVATLPDLDSLIPFEDLVASVTYHRSWSHSLLVLSIAAPVFAWLLLKLKPAYQEDSKRWYWFFALALMTHPLLDAFTVYGTQLFWPVWDYPVSGSAVFIIDPAYTVPLIIGTLAAFRFPRGSIQRSHINSFGLIVSSLYLVWALAAKTAVELAVRSDLEQRGRDVTQLLTTPTPINTFSWRLVAMTEGGYYEGYTTIFSAGDA